MVVTVGFLVFGSSVNFPRYAPPTGTRLWSAILYCSTKSLASRFPWPKKLENENEEISLAGRTGSRPTVAENPSVPQPGLGPDVMSMRPARPSPYSQGLRKPSERRGQYPAVEVPKCSGLGDSS
jgi:hypothetical protein